MVSSADNYFNKKNHYVLHMQYQKHKQARVGYIKILQRTWGGVKKNIRENKSDLYKLPDLSEINFVNILPFFISYIYIQEWFTLIFLKKKVLRSYQHWYLGWWGLVLDLWDHKNFVWMTQKRRQLSYPLEVIKKASC